jgi:hypothetical protein
MGLNKEKTADELIAWVAEAVNIHQVWRKESWEDYEFRDGVQWSEEEKDTLINEKNIQPLTINRITPIIKFIHGWFILNQRDYSVKGRTKEDVELGQVMSEALMFIRDQNKGIQKISNAFLEQIITGIGCTKVFYNSDPRKEKVSFTRINWHDIWWDPFSTPWFDSETARYAFTAPWKDLDVFCSFFPDKAQEIKEQFDAATSDSLGSISMDESASVEDFKRQLSSMGYWTDTERKRIRPVEMWYPVFDERLFLKMRNGRILDLEDMSGQDRFEALRYSKELITATVRKMRVAVLFNNMKVYDIPSPLPFDDFPFSTFVAYTDRFGLPFGVPRELTDLSKELNKRRSVALARADDFRMFTEKGAVEDLDTAYSEANRSRGHIILTPGKMGKVVIEDLKDLASTQMALAQQTRQEINEVSGTLDESMAIPDQVQSEGALQEKKGLQNIKLASLFQNADLAIKDLGTKLCSMIQDSWTEEKTFRVTDRMTGVDAFVKINQSVVGPNGETIQVKNNIAESTFDIVVTTSQVTDTQRDKTLDLIFSALNKAPPEAIAPLLNLGLAMSDIPDKGEWLEQIMNATGMEKHPDGMSKEDKDAAKLEKAKAAQQQQEFDRNLAIQTQTVANQEKAANTEKLRAEALATLKEADRKKDELVLEQFKVGQEAAKNLGQERGSKV